MLHLLATGDAGTSWLAVHALRSDLPPPCLKGAQSVGSSSSWDGPFHFTATFPATISVRFKLDLKESPTTNYIKRELGQTAAAKSLAC